MKHGKISFTVFFAFLFLLLTFAPSMPASSDGHRQSLSLYDELLRERDNLYKALDYMKIYSYFGRAVDSNLVCLPTKKPGQGGLHIVVVTYDEMMDLARKTTPADTPAWQRQDKIDTTLRVSSELKQKLASEHLPEFDRQIKLLHGRYHRFMVDNVDNFGLREKRVLGEMKDYVREFKDSNPDCSRFFGKILFREIGRLETLEETSERLEGLWELQEEQFMVGGVRPQIRITKAVMYYEGQLVAGTLQHHPIGEEIWWEIRKVWNPSDYMESTNEYQGYQYDYDEYGNPHRITVSFYLMGDALVYESDGQLLHFRRIQEE